MARENDRISRTVRLVCGAGVGVVLFLVLLATLDDVGMVIDEPYFLSLEDRQRDWWRQLGDVESWSERKALFAEAALRGHFDLEDPTGRFRSGLDHPILGRHLANLSCVAVKPWAERMARPFGVALDRWLAARLATAVLFAVAGAVMFCAVASRYGTWGGATAAAALVLMPRVFGHAHVDALDLQVAAWWFLSFCTFFRALRSWPATVAFAVLVGLAWATQFSGILVLVPLAGWALLARRRDAIRPLLAALVAAPLVLVIVSPHWWHHPLVGIWEFVARSTSRRAYMSHHCYYLGRRYVFGLPWHNAPVLVAATVPVGLLALGLVGLLRGCGSIGTALRGWIEKGRGNKLREAPSGPSQQTGPAAALSGREAFAAALTLVVLFWLAVRALPASPDHDGVRLFLHAFVFLAPLAGIGAAEILRWAARNVECGTPSSKRFREGNQLRIPHPALRAWLPRVAVLFALACAAFELCWIHPYHLSYYNRLVGHPDGARALGFESTYWADAITPEVVGWINDRAPTTVYAPWTPTLITLSTLGYLEREVRLAPVGPRWIVIISRQSNYDPERQAGHSVQPERRILEEGRPAKTWSTRDGVPLVRIYEGAPGPAMPGSKSAAF